MTLAEAYELLELEPDATNDDIKSQYRRLVKIHHPDMGGDTKRFIEIQAAYEILKTINQDLYDDDVTIPIPEELRGVVDEIVRSFKKQYLEAEAFCDDRLNWFRNYFTNYISNASRKDLRKFSEYFVQSWNAFITGMFNKFNSDCRKLIKKYDSWFERSTEDVFKDMYRKDLRSYKKSVSFYFHVLVLASIGFLIGYNAWRSSGTDENQTMDILRGIGMAFSFSGLSMVTWWIRCNTRRKSFQDVKILSIVPFRMHGDSTFQGSETLREGRVGTMVAGGVGFGVAYEMTSGIGGPLLGAAAGLLVGGIADRIMNPTGKIRKEILIEFEKFIDSARPEITKYVLKVHQDLLEDMSEQIIANYEGRMKQTCRMLASG